jgi:hypothetical protein
MFADPLTVQEAKLICDDFDCAIRILKSYRMMLNFYGLELVDENTGEVRRHPLIWRNRFRNLLNRSHNNLRIDRILQSLGQLGFARYKTPLVELLKNEVYNTKELISCRYSFENYWKKTLHKDIHKHPNGTKEPQLIDYRESIFFYHMNNNTSEWKRYKKEWEEFFQQQLQTRAISDQQEINEFQTYTNEKRMCEILHIKNTIGKTKNENRTTREDCHNTALKSQCVNNKNTVQIQQNVAKDPRRRR